MNRREQNTKTETNTEEKTIRNNAALNLFLKEDVNELITSYLLPKTMGDRKGLVDVLNFKLTHKKINSLLSKNNQLNKTVRQIRPYLLSVEPALKRLETQVDTSDEDTDNLLNGWILPAGIAETRRLPLSSSEAPRMISESIAYTNDLMVNDEWLNVLPQVRRNARLFLLFSLFLLACSITMLSLGCAGDWENNNDRYVPISGSLIFGLMATWIGSKGMRSYRNYSAIKKAQQSFNSYNLFMEQARQDAANVSIEVIDDEKELEDVEMQQMNQPLLR